MSGEASTPRLLAFIRGSSSETNYLVWSQMLGSLGTIKSIFSDNTMITDGLRDFILKLVTPSGVESRLGSIAR